MSEAWMPVITALVTGLLSLLGVYLANRKSSALIAYRLQELEKKVDKHNGLVERMTAVEVKVKDMESDIAEIKKVVSVK